MWNYLLKLYSVISGIWYGLKIVNFLPVSCSPGLLSPIVVALPVYSLCWHILPLKLCLTPLSSQAQLKHHLLQTHLDSDHPLLGLGVCPLYFLGIMWIYLWHCTTDNANTSDSNIIEAACVFHNLPNTVQALHNMTSASLTKLYHLITVIPISQLVTLRPERLDSMWKPIQLERCVWI